MHINSLSRLQLIWQAEVTLIVFTSPQKVN